MTLETQTRQQLWTKQRILQNTGRHVCQPVPCPGAAPVTADSLPMPRGGAAPSGQGSPIQRHWFPCAHSYRAREHHCWTSFPERQPNPSPLCKRRRNIKTCKEEKNGSYTSFFIIQVTPKKQTLLNQRHLQVGFLDTALFWETSKHSLNGSIMSIKHSVHTRFSWQWFLDAQPIDRQSWSDRSSAASSSHIQQLILQPCELFCKLKSQRHSNYNTKFIPHLTVN